MVESKSAAPDNLAQEVEDGGRIPHSLRSTSLSEASVPQTCSWSPIFVIGGVFAAARDTASDVVEAAAEVGACRCGGISSSCCSCGDEGGSTPSNSFFGLSTGIDID